MAPLPEKNRPLLAGIGFQMISTEHFLQNPSFPFGRASLANTSKA